MTLEWNYVDGNVLGLGKALKIVTRGTGGKTLEIGVNGRRPVRAFCLIVEVITNSAGAARTLHRSSFPCRAHHCSTTTSYRWLS